MAKIQIQSNVVYKDNLYNCDSRFFLVYGGGGSGKSHEVALRWLLFIMTVPNERVVYARKTLISIRQSNFEMFKTIISECGLDDRFSILENTMTITSIDTGSQLLPFGMNNPRRFKSFTKPTKVWLEEADECSEDDFNLIDGRLRDLNPEYLQILLTFNPISKEHWLKKRFFIDSEKNPIDNVPIGKRIDITRIIEVDGVEVPIKTSILRTTYHENRFISMDYKANLEMYKNVDYNYYKVYCLGEWGSLERGTVFKRDFYREYNELPADARGVIYCDQNLTLKKKGDFTAITKLMYSASEDCYFVEDLYCHETTEIKELLGQVLNMMADNCRLVGFDGNVSQEANWTNHVRAYAQSTNRPYPAIHYKRYRVDELAKNAQLTWCEGKIKFKKGLNKTEQGEQYLSQMFAFCGKKNTDGHDDAPDSLICALQFIVEMGVSTAAKFGEVYNAIMNKR